MQEFVETKESEPAPDSLECNHCKSEIPHDEHCYYVVPCFNLHGSPQAHSGKEDEVLCVNCVQGQLRDTR